MPHDVFLLLLFPNGPDRFTKIEAEAMLHESGRTINTPDLALLLGGEIGDDIVPVPFSDALKYAHRGARHHHRRKRNPRAQQPLGPVEGRSGLEGPRILEVRGRPCLAADDAEKVGSEPVGAPLVDRVADRTLADECGLAFDQVLGRLALAGAETGEGRENSNRHHQRQPPSECIGIGLEAPAQAHVVPPSRLLLIESWWVPKETPAPSCSCAVWLTRPGIDNITGLALLKFLN